MAKKKASRPLIAKCVTVAGNLAAGVVLYRLNFWKPTRTINGRLMFAKPRSEIEFETGLSSRQVENALSKLRNDGLIVTAQHPFHGRNVLHVAVTEKCIQALRNGDTQYPENGVLSTPKSGCSVPPNGGTLYTTYIQGESQGVLQGECELAFATALPSDNSISGEEMKVKKKPKSVRDVILNSTFQKPVPKNGSKDLGLRWCKLVSEVYGVFCPPLTLKQVGQLKQFRAKCPPDKADEILDHVIRNWTEFSLKVESEAGLKTSPSMPNIDFLLKHAGVAANLFLGSKKPVVQEANPVNSSATSVQLIAKNEPEETPHTLEELLDVLKEGPTGNAV